MSHPFAEAVDIELGGETYQLKWAFESIAVAEEVTGKTLISGMTRKEFEAPKVSLVRAMLYGCLLPNHPKVDYSTVAAFVTRKIMQPIWSKVVEAWVIGVNEPEEDDTEIPTRAQS